MLIRISSDSTCDLRPEWIAAHQVHLVPLYTLKGGETFRDGIDILPQDIFDHVAAGGDLCSTAANNVADYEAVFSKLLETCDAVIHITISADFSSCYQNACIAAENFPNVYVVDSRNLSSGHGHIVCEAVRLAEAQELDAAEIADALRDMTDRVEASFLLDRLDYMRKGGRCSAVVALGANLLKLKPCISVENGSMHVGKKYRGNFKKCILEYVRDQLSGRDDLQLDRIFITHTPVEDDLVDAVKEAILTYAPFSEVVETEAGCTISCHCGPGTLGILFFHK